MRESANLKVVSYSGVSRFYTSIVPLECISCNQRVILHRHDIHEGQVSPRSRATIDDRDLEFFRQLGMSFRVLKICNRQHILQSVSLSAHIYKACQVDCQSWLSKTVIKCHPRSFRAGD